jgi:hypothetical protein
MGFKLRFKDIRRKKFIFTISKMFENVLFFEHMHYRRKTNWVIPELGKQTGFYF